MHKAGGKMTDHNRATKPRQQIAQETRAEIEPRVAAGIGASIVDVYEDLFSTIWQGLTPTLGAVTLATIIERAVRRTAVEYELMRLITVNQDGIDFDQLNRITSDSDQEFLREGFKLLVANLLDILTKLTGNVLVNELIGVA
jgi:hypothetical protein